ITAVGMADHLIIMIIAVMLAVFLMMIFIDPISNFINGHPEMKMLALTFIVAIGGLLVIDSAGFHTGIELLHMPLEKLIVYFAMVFCIVLELIQMRYNANFLAWRKDRWKNETAAQIDSVRAEMMEQMKREDARPQDADASGVSDARSERITPVIIGNNVYVLMPMAGEDAASFKELMATSDTANAAFGQPLEIGAQVEDVPASEDPSYEVPEGKSRLSERDLQAPFRSV
ncbi:MAG: TerC family protein, partial [Eggerthella lenta]